MDNLDLLWQLQKHDDNIGEIKEKLEELQNQESIKKISNSIKKSELKLTDLKFRLKEIEKEINRNNSTLKDLDFKLNEVEKELYNGNINDLKQLGYLDKEREILKERIDEKEIEIISQMEEMENLKIELAEIEKDFWELKVEYVKVIEEYEKLIYQFKQEADKETYEKEKIVSQIDEKTLKKYIQLQRIKGNAVVEVIDSKCGGCNVLLPTIIIDRLRFENEIVHCENCDRILYYKR